MAARRHGHCTTGTTTCGSCGIIDLVAEYADSPLLDIDAMNNPLSHYAGPALFYIPYLTLRHFLGELPRLAIARDEDVSSRAVCSGLTGPTMSLR